MAGLSIDSGHLDAMTQAALASYPQDCCGLLVGRRVFAVTGQSQSEEDHREVLEVVAVENAWERSQLAYTDAQGSGEMEHSLGDRYWIDPAAMLQVQRSARERELEIIGIYHSHPDHPAVPSECDRRLAWPVYSYVILSVQSGQVMACQSWRLDDQHQFQPEAIKMIGSSANKAPFLS
jgi:proteasome lid subunit RPN8/RPN11